jgi:hypothetical protein
VSFRKRERESDKKNFNLKKKIWEFKKFKEARRRRRKLFNFLIFVFDY